MVMKNSLRLISNGLKARSAISAKFNLINLLQSCVVRHITTNQNITPFLFIIFRIVFKTFYMFVLKGQENRFTLVILLDLQTTEIVNF